RACAKLRDARQIFSVETKFGKPAPLVVKASSKLRNRRGDPDESIDPMFILSLRDSAPVFVSDWVVLVENPLEGRHHLPSARNDMVDKAKAFEQARGNDDVRVSGADLPMDETEVMN